MFVKTPDRTYALGETLPPIGQRVVSWPWASSRALTDWSIAALKYPLGAIIYDVVDGHPVIAQLQTHDSYGAHPEWGTKLHKGTSVFVPVSVDSAGHPSPLSTPPDGWGSSSPMGHEHARMPSQRGLAERIARREVDWSVDPFAVGSVYIAQGDDGSGPPPSPLPQPSPSPQGVHVEHWKDRYEKIPKAIIVAGTTVLGALAGPLGAVVGLAAGLLVDREVRGGSLLPDRGHWRDWSGIHGDFGIGTIIPSYKPLPAPKTFAVQELDANQNPIGQTYSVAMPDAGSAATFAAVKFFGGTGATKIAGDPTNPATPGVFSVTGTSRVIYVG